VAERRNRMEIINDMLIAIQQKQRIKPTHLMYKSNLSHKLLKNYLDELIDKEFVKEETTKNDYKYLIITDKGHEFLQNFRKMKEFTDSFGL
jgi:predicted transcriptional regulator